jgi:hypothetical protein
VKNYVVKFQHFHYFKICIKFCVGHIISSGSGDHEKIWYENDNTVRIWIETPSCHASWGQHKIDENLLENILSSILQFAENYGN